MIRYRDTMTLSLTKLRTRKVRLSVTVIVSGLLFTGLAGASMVARGAFQSIDDFSEEGFSSRFLVSAYPQTGDVYGVYQNEGVMARALEIHKETIARKKIEAKRLGITYDPLTDMPPVEEFDTGFGKQKNLDMMHPAAVVALAEYEAANPIPGLQELESVAKHYNASAYYESESRPYVGDGSTLAVLKDGKENYSMQEAMMGPPTGTDSFVMGWNSMSKGLLEPFLLPGQNLDKTDDYAIPILIPADAAEQLLGLTALPGGADSAERLSRTKEVREKAADLRFEVCYRNKTSAGLVQQAVSVQHEIDRNKANKDFVKPELIYELPADACGASPVARDVRTAETKRQAAKQEEFDRIFGKQAASQTKLRFRVVGIVPSFDFGASSTVTQIFSSLLVSSLGSGWFSPNEYIESDPPVAAIFSGPSQGGPTSKSYYAEFSSPDQAKLFMDQENCTPDYSIAGMDPTQAVAECEATGKIFSISPYGSNSLGLESAKSGFGKVFKWAALIVAVIAAIIMMGTVGRMITDSRRETAVFRAIGAKKIDIAQIYILYTVMLSLLVFIFAAVVGSIFAAWLHNRYAEEATVQALVAYNAQDLDRSFLLYKFYLPDMVYLIMLTLGAGLISSTIPLLRNLRRNPIRDMRDDT